MWAMADQPNIVLFMTDQLRADALGCYGNTICPTPNLDRFAASGRRFDSAFTTSPVCSPSRASLMTGQYPHNHGVILNTHISPALSRGLDPATPTFSSVLKAAGYQLDYLGKWHVHQDRDPTEYGFDRYESDGGKGGRVEGSEISIDFPGGPYPIAATSPHAPEELTLAVRVRRGLEIIDERAAQGVPFFLRIDVLEPHFACVPPEPYASLIDPAEIPPWPNFDETFEGKPESHLRKHREWNLEGKDWHWWSQVVAKYYGVIAYLDACFGDLVQGLEARGLNANTIVLFSTDHGDAMGSHKHFEKSGTLYDEVYRVPLLMSGPTAGSNGGFQTNSCACSTWHRPLRTGPAPPLRRRSTASRPHRSRPGSPLRSGPTPCTRKLTAKSGATTASGWCGRTSGNTAGNRTVSMSSTI